MLASTRKVEFDQTLAQLIHFVAGGTFLAGFFQLTALPLSNKAEFVTKMNAGIERKFNQLLRERVQKSIN